MSKSYDSSLDNSTFAELSDALDIINLKSEINEIIMNPEKFNQNSIDKEVEPQIWAFLITYYFRSID